MEDLTVVLIIGAVALYIISLIIRKPELNWLALVVSVCSMGASILDQTLDPTQMMLLFIPDLFITFLVGLKVMGVVNNG